MEDLGLFGDSKLPFSIINVNSTVTILTSAIEVNYKKTQHETIRDNMKSPVTFYLG